MLKLLKIKSIIIASSFTVLQVRMVTAIKKVIIIHATKREVRG